MAGIEVVGIEQLQALARDLKQAGDRDLRRELLRSIQKASKPLKTGAKEAALEDLPKSGGLAERVAASKWSTSTRLGVRSPSIRITGRGTAGVVSKQLDLNSLDRGRLRHLTYGRRPWKDQAVKVHWFSDRMELIADTTVRDDILSAVDTVAAKLGGSHL